MITLRYEYDNEVTTKDVSVETNSDCLSGPDGVLNAVKDFLNSAGWHVDELIVRTEWTEGQTIEHSSNDE